MEFTSILVSLPPDGIDLIVLCTLFPGLEIIAIFDSANQIFTVVESGLFVPAYSVIEWKEVV